MILGSIPLEGRVRGVAGILPASLPNPKRGAFALAAESVDLIAAPVPESARPEEAEGSTGGDYWRHLIGIQRHGRSLRQIIERNGRLSLTRLGTQAPPQETLPEEFVRRYDCARFQGNDHLHSPPWLRGRRCASDLVVLTTPANKTAMEEKKWESARSVSIYTPYEAGLNARPRFARSRRPSLRRCSACGMVRIEA